MERIAKRRIFSDVCCMAPVHPRLKLSHYFGIEALTGFSGILYLYCGFFWTKARFGYSDTLNLLLSSFHGLLYIFLALYGGKLADRIGYDRMLSACAAGMAVVLLAGWIPDWQITPFLTLGLFTLFFAPFWPALEAVILHCPSSIPMPTRLGFFNICWALNDGLGFACSAFLFAWKPDSVLWVPGLLFAVMWFWIKLTPMSRDSAGETAMEMPHRGDDVPKAVKRRFMLTAWLANGLAYLMLGGFFALAPSMGQHLGLKPEYAILLVSTLLFTRTASFVVFWKWEAWHYHMGWSQLALWLAPVTLAVAFFSTSILFVLAALIVFGAAIGLSYSGSLYYSLDYSERKGEQGGFHEAILGAGWFIGPLLAAPVSGLGGGTHGAQWTILALTLSTYLAGLWIIRVMNSDENRLTAG